MFGLGFALWVVWCLLVVLLGGLFALRVYCVCFYMVFWFSCLGGCCGLLAVVTSVCFVLSFDCGLVLLCAGFVFWCLVSWCFGVGCGHCVSDSFFVAYI